MHLLGATECLVSSCVFVSIIIPVYYAVLLLCILYTLLLSTIYLSIIYIYQYIFGHIPLWANLGDDSNLFKCSIRHTWYSISCDSLTSCIQGTGVVSVHHVDNVAMY
jgi:hypothetical protein